MNGKIISFGGTTTLNMPPDKVLKSAIGKLESVIIIGYDKNENEYFASSIADSGDILWLIERCKQELLTLSED